MLSFLLIKIEKLNRQNHLDKVYLQSLKDKMKWMKFILADIMNIINQDQKIIKTKINLEKLIFNFNKTNRFNNQLHHMAHFIF